MAQPKELTLTVILTENDGEYSVESSQGVKGETTSFELLAMIQAAHQTLNSAMKTALYGKAN